MSKGRCGTWPNMLNKAFAGHYGLGGIPPTSLKSLVNFLVVNQGGKSTGGTPHRLHKP